MYRLANATAAPTDPLGHGVIEDSYADKLDAMACCRGDYGLQHRIEVGWVKGRERLHVPTSKLKTRSVVRVQLWPFDRAESRGRLKGITLRPSPSTSLVIGYRSVPFWQDVRLAPYVPPAASGSTGGTVTPSVFADGTTARQAGSASALNGVPATQAAAAAADVGVGVGGAVEAGVAEGGGYTDESGGQGGDWALVPGEMRGNVEGVTVELSRAYLDPDGACLNLYLDLFHLLLVA